ncbi:putative nucleotidyltransferase with HDIG domain [Actinomadura coerulea]|uniref:Putative nucleotidyltransferase with HDIG domain n=1 Tax=Actinomadura coerulea TaxID=46159 RepID=A0A7X0FZA7_9ACTN|nr:HD-GYP domain-containing protein [Actinomadura coerulea]MBB6395621.1 putative nucleotidyltransferase with HDIG domain [Actinomadura coerulea]GGQ25060.1 metal-dependent phosphohydrolase [Actinomadura coerulea]
MFGLPRLAGLYLCAVVTSAGFSVASASLGGSFAVVDRRTMVALVVLFLVCDSVTARLNIQGARVSLGFAVSLASVVLLGPAGAALVGASAVATGQRRVSPVKRLFNGAQFALSGVAAGIVFRLVGGDGFEPGRPGWVGHVIAPFTAALATFVAANLALTAGILLLSERAAARELIHVSGPVAGGCLGYGMFGLLIAGLWGRLGPLVGVLVLLPLLVARWALEQAFAQQRAQSATLAALCQAVETKDPFTRGHCGRVSRAAVMIARQLGMRPARVEALRSTGMLHDVGKIGVPTRILTKDGPLTDEEYAAVQLHPMRGLEIVREIGFLDEALAGIMHHHERMDGGGYPLGLAGDEIPEFARVIGVADAFDVMTSTRPYRKARPIEAAVRELRRCSGSQFDPVMVEAFLRALESDGWGPGTERRAGAGSAESAAT